MKSIIAFIAVACFAELSFVSGQGGVFDAPARTHYSSNDIPFCFYGVPSDTLAGIEKKSLPKSIKDFLAQMKFIKGGNSVLARNRWLNPTENDTTLLFFNHDKKISTVSFLMSETEVTNGEYREFTDWVRDSIARAFLALKNPKYYSDASTKQINMDIAIDWSDSLLKDFIYLKEQERFYKKNQINTGLLKYSYIDEAGKRISIKIYPDTLRWVLDFSYSFNEPMTGYYFWHPAYNNYPVVGVSWQQAKAYCDWKTKQLKSLFKKLNFESKGFTGYRLPYNYEWEYAAAGGQYSSLHYKAKEAWIADKDGKCHANFGTIRDRNDVYIRYFVEDGAFHTIIVKHYDPNFCGLYEMAGNVSEWTEDAPPPVSLKSYFGCTSGVDTLPKVDFIITEKDNIHTLLKRICEITKLIPDWEEADTISDFGRKRILSDVENLLHDWSIMHTKDSLRIVKGGSWADPPVYLITGMDGIYPEDKSSCKIGFRLAMSLSDYMIPYLYSDSKSKIIRKMEKENMREKRNMQKAKKR